ncbi:MAG: hypothetical protein NT090_05040 [Acidobacteria bacterium]|nr:hypothetical protein [Acidobacteriota bacterium]
MSAILERLSIGPVNSGACSDEWIENPAGGELASINPSDGSVIARVRMPAWKDFLAEELLPPGKHEAIIWYIV